MFLGCVQVLSQGEQQRLAFARVLYAKPSVLFLDESTCALDVDTEKEMYTLLLSWAVTLVSVGHRESLIRYHSKELKLSCRGAELILL